MIVADCILDLIPFLTGLNPRFDPAKCFGNFQVPRGSRCGPCFDELVRHELLKLLELRVLGYEMIGSVDRDHSRACAAKNPVKRIKVFVGYWVELVIMATRAGNGQALKRFTDGVDLVVDHRDLFSLDVQGRLIELDESVETKADERFVAIQGIIPSRFDQIAGQMLLNESLNR